MEQLSKKNRIQELMKEQNGELLSIYYTAGFPRLNDTEEIAVQLEKAGVDLIEVGIPYSDPVADGPTIQKSNQWALDNGMTVTLLMEQLKSMRTQVQVPIVLMSYFNPILQYGLPRFCHDCQQRGVSALIIPDLPIQEYLDHYQQLFKQHHLHSIFLITPQTSEERIRWIDSHSESFIYAVADASITGAKSAISESQISYFKKLQALNLAHPFLIGFGISDRQTFQQACLFSKGAIIGSAFINALQKGPLQDAIHEFVLSIKPRS